MTLLFGKPAAGPHTPTKVGCTDLPQSGRKAAPTRSEVEDLDGGRYVFVGPATAAAGGDAARCTAFRRGAAEHGWVVDVAEAGRSGGDRAGLADLRLGPAPRSHIAGHRRLRCGLTARLRQRRHRDAGGLQCLPLAAGREPVGAFVLHVAGVALHPMPDNLVVAGDGGVEFPPQVLVLDRLALLRTPTVALPVRHPRHDAVADIRAVGMQVDDRRTGECSPGWGR